MSQHDTCDGDAEYARVGEVGQAETAGLVLLTEDHILLGPDQRSPRAHATFQRAPNAGGDLRMAPPNLFEHRYGPNAGSRLQDRHNLAVPNLGQWIRSPSATWRFLLRGQPWIILDAVAGCPAEAGPGGSNGGFFAMSVNHVQPHLVVGDVKAGQISDPSISRRIRHLTRSLTTARPHSPLGEKCAAGAGRTSLGLRPRSVPPAPAQSHPDCRCRHILIGAGHLPARRARQNRRPPSDELLPFTYRPVQAENPAA